LSRIGEAGYSAAMRAIVFALLLLPAACSETPEPAPSDLAQRDTDMAKLMDRTTELEKRVKQLEAEKKLGGRLSAPVAATAPTPLPDFDRDRLENRIKDLERDAGKLPPP
jgi:hypothetical protein